MKKYEFKLQDTSDDFTTAVQVGTHAASLRCTWAIASNEQSDILEKSIREASLRDPLMSRDKMSISRAYDWVEFYYSIRYADIEQWFKEHNTLRPRKADKRIAVQWAMDYYRAASKK